MKANCWMGKGKVQVEDVPDPRLLNARDAIIKVSSTAICGSDLHLFGGYIPTMEKGDILGHEFMGEVVEVGAEAKKKLKVGDRVVVPFPIACGNCFACEAKQFSLCENSNPNAWLAEKLLGHAASGCFGYSHMTGGFAGGQAEYVRVPFADVGPIKVPSSLTDDQVLFLSDIFPTGYMGAELCEIHPRKTIAVWGAGPVGQFAVASARLLGAEKIICIDRFDYRLKVAREKAGATDIINYEREDVHEALLELTAGRGPDACIDAVGLEAHGHGLDAKYDLTKQALKLESDRPTALRQCIRECANGGIVSIMGVYGGFIDKFPIGSIMNRSLTLRSGQCHVQRYLPRLLAHIEKGDIDPSFVISHHLPLAQAPRGYEMFKNKEDDCLKVVMRAQA
jgi:threonine dehydrogenase-like Zn-dependent dehydrogenase